MASVDNTLLYVAIDFGTTFSGYAFQFKGKKNEVKVNNNWGAAVGFQAYKVPTCVVTDALDNFVAFGYEAQIKYTNNSENDSDDSDGEGDGNTKKTEKKKLHYYDEFKMMLRDKEEEEKKMMLGDKQEEKGRGKGIHKHMKLRALDGHECLAIKIFAMALDFLRTHLLGTIAQQILTVPNEDEIQWVLTVPAIWSDSAKQFMRECAVQAGLVRKDSSEKLLVALEPEAASLYCRTLNLGTFNVKENVPAEDLSKTLPQGSHYLVVDCGGGTVDVTAHHYKKGGDICELYAASGGGWGGRNINLQYEQKLDEVLGANFMEKFKLKYPVAYLDRKVKFEKEKRSIEFKNETFKYVLPCGYEFIQLCEQRQKKPIKMIVKYDTKSKIEDDTKLATHGVRFTNGTLVFPREVLLAMFAPSVERIKNHIVKLLGKEELKQIKYIFLVGGFSDCSLLQDVFQKEFKGKDIHIILAPLEASLAVVKGAVQFGSNPHAIASRRTRSYYCTDDFQSVHPSKRKRSTRRRGGRALVPIVKQNVEIYNDDCVPTRFYPFNIGKSFKLYHYQSDASIGQSRGVKCTTDDDVSVIDINLSDAIGSDCTEDTKISIYLYFGSTELHVTARNDKTPGLKTKPESFDCLQNAESDSK